MFKHVVVRAHLKCLFLLWYQFHTTNAVSILIISSDKCSYYIPYFIQYKTVSILISRCYFLNMFHTINAVSRLISKTLFFIHCCSIKTTSLVYNNFDRINAVSLLIIKPFFVHGSNYIFTSLIYTNFHGINAFSL